MSVEEYNSREEIKEIVEKCVNCGLCNALCPVLRVLREEKYSPRGKTMLLISNYYERLIYDCTLCRLCEKNCPLDLQLCTAFIKARNVLVLKKQDPSESKEAIKNIQKTGNIYRIKS